MFLLVKFIISEYDENTCKISHENTKLHVPKHFANIVKFNYF
jgi:hypothetical protein